VLEVTRLIELVEGREELAEVGLLEVCEEGMNRLDAIDDDSVASTYKLTRRRPRAKGPPFLLGIG
jgi:hypothetical protein